jgi:hypothetical protein
MMCCVVFTMVKYSMLYTDCRCLSNSSVFVYELASALLLPPDAT